MRLASLEMIKQKIHLMLLHICSVELAKVR